MACEAQLCEIKIFIAFLFFIYSYLRYLENELLFVWYNYLRHLEWTALLTEIQIPNFFVIKFLSIICDSTARPNKHQQLLCPNCLWFPIFQGGGIILQFILNFKKSSSLFAPLRRWAPLANTSSLFYFFACGGEMGTPCFHIYILSSLTISLFLQT
jgi:hypothetical protein